MGNEYMESLNRYTNFWITSILEGLHIQHHKIIAHPQTQKIRDIFTESTLGNDNPMGSLQKVKGKISPHFEKMKAQAEVILNFFCSFFQLLWISARMGLPAYQATLTLPQAHSLKNANTSSSSPSKVTPVKIEEKSVPEAKQSLCPKPPSSQTTLPIAKAVVSSPAINPIPSAPLLPQAPGIALPPPPPPPKEKKLISPEEVHRQREQRKLANQMKARANPENFYKITHPKNAEELTKRIASYKRDIEVFSNNLSTLSDPAQIRDVQERISAKEKEIASIEEELKGTRAALRFQSELLDKIKTYTNQEIKILIGLFFEGSPPSEKHPNYPTYQRNQELLKPIFDNWNLLLRSEIGQAFLEHEAEWKNYLNITITSFVDILHRRYLPSGKDALEEPNYEITPYQPPGTKKTIVPRTIGKLQSETIVEALKKKFNTSNK